MIRVGYGRDFGAEEENLALNTKMLWIILWTRNTIADR
jgi:hypothetical protein